MGPLSVQCLILSRTSGGSSTLWWMLTSPAWTRTMSVLVYGALHWLTGSSCILLLHLKDHRWRKMIPPDEVGCGGWGPGLGTGRCTCSSLKGYFGDSDIKGVDDHLGAAELRYRGGPAFGRSGQSSMHEGLSAGNLADQSDSCACMYSWPLISRFWRIRGRTECGSICFLWTTGSRYLETRQVLMSECKTRIQRTLKTVSVTILKPREMGQTWEILNVQGLKNKLAKILGLGRHIWYRSRMYPTRKVKEKLRPSSVSTLSPGGMVLLQIPNFFDSPLLLCSG